MLSINKWSVNYYEIYVLLIYVLDSKRENDVASKRQTLIPTKAENFEEELTYVQRTEFYDFFLLKTT